MGWLLVILLLLAPSLFIAAWAIAVITRDARRRRRQRRRARGMTEREVADALAPFGVDISIWPSRAPRNGSAYDYSE